MFLNIIHNSKTLKNTFSVSETKNVNSDVVVSFELLKQLYNSFFQQLITYEQFKISTLKHDDALWVDIPIIKNLLVLLSLLNIIKLNEQNLLQINQFSSKHGLKFNDLQFFGYQSPLKTFRRDLSTQPKFLKKILSLADSHKRLVSTTLYFSETVFLTVNKRNISPFEFVHHLNSDRDRIRIQESLTEPDYQKINNFITTISQSQNNQLNNDLTDDVSTSTSTSTSKITTNKDYGEIAIADETQHQKNKEKKQHNIEKSITISTKTTSEQEIDIDSIMDELDKQFPYDDIVVQNQTIKKNNTHQTETTIKTLKKSDMIHIQINQWITEHNLSKSQYNPLHKTNTIPIDIFNFVSKYNLIKNEQINDIDLKKQKIINLSLDEKTEQIQELYDQNKHQLNLLVNFNHQGDNPLCIASYKENIELVKLLIHQGWSPNFFDGNMNNALIIACAEGHKHIVKFLLNQKMNINFQNKKGFSALHFAANDCNHRIVKLLIDQGADMNCVDNDKNTPLSIAAYRGDFQSAKLLLEKPINIHVKNKNGYDARSIALIFKHHSIAKLIEDKIIEQKHTKTFPPFIQKTIE